MAEQLNLQVNVTGNATESVGSLRRQLREASAEVAILSEKFGATSKEAATAAKRAADLRDRIGDAQLLTQAFNPDQKFRALANALSGVAGGFSAVQGAIGLFGIESKEVEKQLLKVQSALALAQGLNAIGDSIDAFKALKTFIVVEVIPAIKALGTAAQVGIGLLITAVVGAVVAWKEYIDTQEQVQKAQEETNKTIEKGAKAQLEGELAFVDRDSKLRLARLKNVKDNEQAIFEEEQFSRKQRIEGLQRYYEQIKNINVNEGIKVQNDIKNLQTDIEVAEITHQGKLAEIKNAAYLKEKERLKKISDDAREAQSRMMALELQALENRSQAAKKQASEDDEYIANQFAQEDKLQEKRIQTSNKRILTEKQQKELIKNAETELYEARFQLLGATLQLFASFAGQNEKIANAAFILDKAVAIAKIIIDTQREIALISANPVLTTLPDLGASIKGPAIAAAKIRAAASIATIGALTIAKFKNGSTSGFGGSTGTLGVAPIQPSLPQAQLTSLNQATINALGNQAIRAYVVETDVTTNQKRIEAIKQKAKFG